MDKAFQVEFVKLSGVEEVIERIIEKHVLSVEKRVFDVGWVFERICVA